MVTCAMKSKLCRVMAQSSPVASTHTSAARPRLFSSSGLSKPKSLTPKYAPPAAIEFDLLVASYPWPLQVSDSVEQLAAGTDLRRGFPAPPETSAVGFFPIPQR